MDRLEVQQKFADALNEANQDKRPLSNKNILLHCHYKVHLAYERKFC